MKKIIRACTVSQSVGFVSGMLPDLMQKYEVVLLSSSGDELEETAAKYGVRIVPVAMERHISVAKDCISLWKIWRTFRKERPSMVHSMTPKAGMLCMVAAWLARVPVRVHTFTGLVFPTSMGLKRRILMFTDWLTCACATHVIPEGEGVKNDLINNGITKKPMKVLGYGNVRGIDLEKFNPLKHESAKDGSVFTFLFVGRIVGDKGINELVEAFTRLNGHNQNTRLVLVGKFEADLDPIKEVTKHRIEANDSIVCTGPKYGDELVQAYADADCFVFPSYREGFPNTVLEAGAMGLPCVVTDINGSREIIIDGENGLIIPSKNVDALYEAMWRMINDKEKRQSMASKARELIETRYEQSYVRKCLYEFYDDILKA